MNFPFCLLRIDIIDYSYVFFNAFLLHFKFKITKQGGENVDEKDIKTLTLTCRKYNSKSSTILFNKNKEDFIFKDNYWHSEFKPEDTRELDYGIYNFDIECTLTDGTVKTLKSQFEITEEDTIYERS